MKASVLPATILSACAVLAAHADSHAATTEAVVMGHLKAFGADGSRPGG